MEKFKAFKKAIDVKFSIYSKNGTQETKEGPVDYVRGDYRMVGAENEVWPMKPDVFKKNYEVVEEGIGRKKKVIVDVYFTDKEEIVKTSWGAELNAKPGDAIIEASPEDRWVVQPSIFEKTYDRVEKED